MIAEETLSKFEACMLEEKVKHQNPDPYFTHRQEAWERYLQLGYPHKNQDPYKGFPLSKLSKMTFNESDSLEESTNDFQKKDLEALFFSESKGQRLVIVDGVFSPEHSDLIHLEGQVEICDLQTAFATYGQAIMSHWQQQLPKENDPFFLMNHALFSRGCFIYIPQNLKLKAPIEIVQVFTRDSKISHPKLLWMQGKSSQLTLIVKEHYTTQNKEACFCNQSFEFSLGEKAQLEVNRFSFQVPSNNWDFCGIRAYLKSQASLDAIFLKDGSVSQREDFHVMLQGKESRAFLNGSSLLNENKQSHTSVLIEHLEPNCESSQLFKNTLTDSGKGNFFGKIYVHPEAQKTQAYQLNSNLILSDEAKALSKPHLEIFADDVKASHGSTVGKLCPQQLFYLKTRGIEEKQARQLLIQAFNFQVLDCISFEPARVWAKDYFIAQLPKL